MGKWYRLAVAAGFIWTAWWSYDHRLDFEALMQPAPENQKVLRFCRDFFENPPTDDRLIHDGVSKCSDPSARKGEDHWEALTKYWLETDAAKRSIGRDSISLFVGMVAAACSALVAGWAALGFRRARRA